MFVKPTDSALTEHPLRTSVALRVGLCFLLISVATWLASGWLSSSSVAGQAIGSQAPMIVWTLLVGLIAISGIVSLYSLAGLSAIERQLQVAAKLPTQDGDAINQNPLVSPLRPIVGREPSVRGYNRLLQTAIDSQRPQPIRKNSKLDESAITHARAMRVIDTAWAITDEDCVIRYLSPKAKGLLQFGSSINNSDRVSIFASLQIDDPNEVNRFTSRVRVIRSAFTIDTGEDEIHLDVTRSRLSGRDGDCEGMVWLIEDLTSQNLAIRSRDEFLMTATHELRTPLANLHACAEALADEDQAGVEQQKEFCNVIISESIRMGRMIDHLLSMGQIEAGALLIDNLEVDLHEVLGDVEHQVRGQVDEKQQTIVLEVDDKLPTVRGDNDKLRAALINLVGNAVKYTPDAGTVTVRCYAEENVPYFEGSRSSEMGDPESSCVCIEVIDDGPGIAEADQARVFEKFFRCAATQSSQAGNGLGLAFAREVAKLHRGTLSLDSELGVGSTFAMRLPASGQARSGVSH